MNTEHMTSHITQNKNSEEQNTIFYDINPFNNYIEIGNFQISKCMKLSYIPKMFIFNTKTNEEKLLKSNEIFKLLYENKLDAEPLHEFFDIWDGITKEERMDILNKYEKYDNDDDIFDEPDFIKVDLTYRLF